MGDWPASGTYRTGAEVFRLPATLTIVLASSVFAIAIIGHISTGVGRWDTALTMFLGIPLGVTFTKWSKVREVNVTPNGISIPSISLSVSREDLIKATVFEGREDCIVLNFTTNDWHFGIYPRVGSWIANDMKIFLRLSRYEFGND